MSATATLYDWLLFLHVAAAMVWVGGAVLLGALVTVVRRDREPEGSRGSSRACASSGRACWRPPRSRSSAWAYGWS